MIEPQYLSIKDLARRWGMSDEAVIRTSLDEGPPAGIYLKKNHKAIESDVCIPGRDDDQVRGQVRIRGFFYLLYRFALEDIEDEVSSLTIGSLKSTDSWGRYWYQLEAPVKVQFADILFDRADVIKHEEKASADAEFSLALSSAMGSFPLTPGVLKEMAPYGLCMLQEAPEVFRCDNQTLGRKILSGECRLFWEYLQSGDLVFFTCPDKSLVNACLRQSSSDPESNLHTDDYFHEITPGYIRLPISTEKGIAAMLVRGDALINRDPDLGWEIDTVCDIHGNKHYLIAYEMPVVGEDSNLGYTDLVALTGENVYISRPQKRAQLGGWGGDSKPTTPKRTRSDAITTAINAYKSQCERDEKVPGLDDCWRFVADWHTVDIDLDGNLLYPIKGGSETKKCDRKQFNGRFKRAFADA